MTVTFPAWWTPEIAKRVPKIEDVGIELFRPLLGGVRPVYWLDTDEETHQVLFEEREAYLRVVRLGGEVDIEEKLDIHRVQFAVASDNRNVSWDIMAFVQRVLYAYERTGRVTMPSGQKVTMTFLGEALGPILDPQQIRDARMVQFTAQLATPWGATVHQTVVNNLAM